MASLLKYKGVPQAQRMLIYGAPKTGKTVLAGSLAKYYNVLWLDLERGYSSLLGTDLIPEARLQLADADLERIEYIGIPDTPASPVACATLLKMVESKKGWICNTHGTWCCPLCAKQKDEFFQIDLNQMTPDKWVIVIDSGTQFGQSALSQICNRSGIKVEEGGHTTFEVWGAQGAYIAKLFGMFQNMNVNIVVLAHEIEVEMPDKTKRLAASMGTRNVASNFGKYFDHVIRLARAAGKHKVYSLTTSVGNFECGNRWSLDLSKPDVELKDFFQQKQAAKGVDRPATPALTPKPVSPALAALQKKST